MYNLSFHVFIHDGDIPQEMAENLSWPPITLLEICDKFERNVRDCVERYFSQYFDEAKIIYEKTGKEDRIKVTVEYNTIPKPFKNNDEFQSKIMTNIVDQDGLGVCDSFILGVYKDPYYDQNYDNSPYIACIIDAEI